MDGLSVLSASVRLSPGLRGVGAPSDRELPEGGILEPAHSAPSRSVRSPETGSKSHMEGAVRRKMDSRSQLGGTCRGRPQGCIGLKQDCV